MIRSQTWRADCYPLLSLLLWKKPHLAFAWRVILSQGLVEIFYLPAGNPPLFWKEFCGVSQCGWEFIHLENTDYVVDSASSLNLGIWFLLTRDDYWLCLGNIWLDEVISMCFLPHNTSYRVAMHASVLFFASNVLTHSIIPFLFFSIVAQCNSAHFSFTPPPCLVSLLRSHTDLAGFLCWDGGALFCSSHGYPQEAL